MLRNVAVTNQQNGRREFSSAHVASALLLELPNFDACTMWLHLDKEEAGLPQALGCDRVDGRKGEASPCPAESRAAEPLQTEHACALDQPD